MEARIRTFATTYSSLSFMHILKTEDESPEVKAPYKVPVERNQGGYALLKYAQDTLAKKYPNAGDKYYLEPDWEDTFLAWNLRLQDICNTKEGVIHDDNLWSEGLVIVENIERWLSALETTIKDRIEGLAAQSDATIDELASPLREGMLRIAEAG